MSYNDAAKSLQAIYEIKEVDLTKVRTLQVQEKVLPQKMEEKIAHQPKEVEWIEEEIDLGPRFRKFIEPLFLKNPVQVLALPRPIEKAVLDLGYQTIEDFIHKKGWEKALIKTLGASQLESLKGSFSAYLAKNNRKRDTKIDFLSLLYQLTANMEKKQAAILLSAAGIEGLIELSPLETSDVKRSLGDPEKIKRTEEEFRLRHQQKGTKKTLEAIFLDIGSAFFYHWIEFRGGFVELWEFEERFIRKAQEEKLALPTLSLIDRYILPKKDWNLGLIFEKGLIFSSQRSHVLFQELYEALLENFSYSSATYFLDELFRLTQEILIHKGRVISHSECKKILFSLKEFYLSKDKRGKITVERKNAWSQKNSSDGRLRTNSL